MDNKVVFFHHINNKCALAATLIISVCFSYFSYLF